MSTIKISINSEEDALKYLEEALAGGYDNDIIELDFANWPNLQFKATGDRYNSTLTAPMMRALLDLQAQLNRLYAEIVYGKSAKSLTSEDRKEIEIVFSVAEGSSEVRASMSSFLTEFAKAGIDKLTGKQLLLLVAGVGFFYAAPAIYDSHTSAQVSMEAEQNRHKVEMALIQQNETFFSQLAADRDAFYGSLMKSVPDAEEVELAGVKYSQEEIAQITSTERQASELQRLDGQYLVSSLKIKQDSYRIDLIRADDDRVIQTELFKGHLVQSDVDQLFEAFKSERPVALKLAGRVKGEEIGLATILGLQDDARVASRD